MLAYILGATVLDGLLGLIGIFTLSMSERELERLVSYLVAFAAGTMLGAALIHMLPEAIERGASPIFVLIGFLVFFVLERHLKWHHCHKNACDVHPVGPLTIIGDGIHNFIDGVAIAVSFMSSIPLGIATTLSILLHEVAQELGNFAVLVHAGFSRERAIFWSFVSQLTCVLGGILGYFFIPLSYLPLFIALAAGGFLYIAASDLIPELHEERDIRKSDMATFIFLAGVLLIYLLKSSGG